MIDPRGMSAYGWIEWTTKQGNIQMIYDHEVDTKEDAIKKGYRNVESLMESGYYNSGGDTYDLRSDGKVINEYTGQRFDVTKSAFRIDDGTYFQENRSNLSQFADLFSNSEGIAVVGGYVSTAGTVMELADDANKVKLTEEKVATKWIMSAIPTGGSKLAKKIGEPKIGEVINITTMGADKGIDVMRDSKSGPYREN